MAQKAEPVENAFWMQGRAIMSTKKRERVTLAQSPLWQQAGTKLSLPRF